MIPRMVFILFAVALMAVPGYSQTTDALQLQSAREKHVTGRGKKVFYTRRWDLNDLPEFRPGTEVAGTVRSMGSNYFADSHLNDYWAEGFHKYHPNVKFQYRSYGAFAGLLTGLADLTPSRHITFDELQQFQRVFSHDPVEIAVVTGSYDVPGWNYALAIIVHKDNPIAKLTLQQLDGIFGAQRDGGYQGTTWHSEIARSPDENIRTWGKLGLGGEWKDKPIHVYGYNLRYHIPRTFERLVFHGGDMWNEQMHEFANYADASGSIVIEAKQVIDAISNDPSGIGYSTVGYLTPQTKAIDLAAKDGTPYVQLTMDTVRNRTYPLFDEVYFYLNRTPGKPLDPVVKEYLRYILSREGQDAVQRDGKYLPLSADAVREQLKKLE
ncbi:MAG TPA: substrate-binding domain-containing protein [Candidatus Dormibacteraeota bacterium]|nr:substrate-binding domain-containing protein [Candidatus Dormibacteraeota bacterium]